MSLHPQRRVVHLELRTPDAASACVFYARLLGWRAETVHLGAASYISLSLGDAVDGGVVEEERPGPAWLPYVEVPDVLAAAALAERLGGAVVLKPREGPAGWRSVIASPDGTAVGLWQPKPAHDELGHRPRSNGQ